MDKQGVDCESRLLWTNDEPLGALRSRIQADSNRDMR